MKKMGEGLSDGLREKERVEEGKMNDERREQRWERKKWGN